MDRANHDARHLYATALLREGQTYSALNLAITAKDASCTGCLEIKAKCLAALGRHREGREAMEQALQDASYTPTGSSPIQPHRLAGFERVSCSLDEHSNSSTVSGRSGYAMSVRKNGSEREPS
jgi:hypothetical protein